MVRTRLSGRPAKIVFEYAVPDSGSGSGLGFAGGRRSTWHGQKLWGVLDPRRVATPLWQVRDTDNNVRMAQVVIHGKTLYIKSSKKESKLKILDLALRLGINSHDPEEVLTSLGKFGRYV
jgi:hypothetical protein